MLSKHNPCLVHKYVHMYNCRELTPRVSHVAHVMSKERGS